MSWFQFEIYEYFANTWKVHWAETIHENAFKSETQQFVEHEFDRALSFGKLDHIKIERVIEKLWLPMIAHKLEIPHFWLKSTICDFEHMFENVFLSHNQLFFDESSTGG